MMMMMIIIVIMMRPGQVAGQRGTKGDRRPATSAPAISLASELPLLLLSLLAIAITIIIIIGIIIRPPAGAPARSPHHACRGPGAAPTFQPLAQRRVLFASAKGSITVL